MKKMHNRSRTSDDLFADSKNLVKNIEKSVPWYKRATYKTLIYMALIISESCALLMIIASVNDNLSPVLVLTPTVVYSLLYLYVLI